MSADSRVLGLTFFLSLCLFLPAFGRAQDKTTWALLHSPEDDSELRMSRGDRVFGAGRGHADELVFENCFRVSSSAPACESLSRQTSAPLTWNDLGRLQEQFRQALARSYQSQLNEMRSHRNFSAFISGVDICAAVYLGRALARSWSRETIGRRAILGGSLAAMTSFALEPVTALAQQLRDLSQIEIEMNVFADMFKLERPVQVSPAQMQMGIENLKRAIYHAHAR